MSPLPATPVAATRTDLVPPPIMALLGLCERPESGDRTDVAWRQGELVLICESAGERDDPAALEAEILAAGARALHLSVSVDRLRIGPMVLPGEPGCMSCLRMWEEPRRRLYAANPLWSQNFTEVAAEAVRAAIAGLPTGTVRLLEADFRGWTTHHFWPHPDCPACSDKMQDSADAAQRLMQPSGQLLGAGLRGRDLRGELPVLERALCDRRFGFTTGVTHQTSAYLQPMAFAPFRIPGATAAEVGVGRTGTRSDDRLVALLEALERFSGLRPRGRRTSERASYAEIADRAVNPRDFILHDEAQYDEPGFRLTPYSDDLRYNWVWAYSFRRAGAVLIPEQLAYYNLAALPERPSNRFVFEISNGCALGSSVEEAVLHGLFETIERDAFLTSWYADRACPELDLTEIDDDHARSLVAVMEGAGFELRCFDVGVGFSVPSVGVAAVDRRPDCPAAVTFAAGANGDPGRAAGGALIELCTMLQRKPANEAAELRARGQALLDRPELVQIASDHISQCRPHAAIDRRCFRTTPAPPISFQDHFRVRRRSAVPVEAGVAVHALVDEVLSVASDVLVVDQSFSGLEKLGLRCVKVLAPGLHSMTFGHQYRRVDRARLDHIDGRGTRPLLPHIFP